MWREKYLAELKKSLMIRNANKDLREEFDEYNSERITAIGKKLLPKYVDAREIPSKRVKIMIMKRFKSCGQKL